MVGSKKKLLENKFVTTPDCGIIALEIQGVWNAEKSKTKVATEKLAMVRVDGIEWSRRGEHGVRDSFSVYWRAQYGCIANHRGTDG